MRDMILRRNKVDALSERLDRGIIPITIHTGRAGGIIEHGAGLIATTPSFHVEPVDPTRKAKTQADQTEKVMAKVFTRQLIRNDFWLTTGKETLSYGRSCVKSLPLPSVWTFQAGYPVRG